MEHSQELHSEILRWVRKELKDILDNSEQAIYVYVCDRHRICNKKFSSMLGYASPEEWEMKEEMMSDVKESDQKTLVTAYKKAMEKSAGSHISVSWKNNKNNSIIKTNVILVPLSYKGESFALHFIDK